MNIKLSVAQTKPEPGDLNQNLKKIKKCIRQAVKDKADILVFSYGSLTGLNMKGLMENSEFVQQVQRFNKQIKKLSGDLRILLPTIIPEGEACMCYHNGEETVFPVSMDENFNNDAERIVINGAEISVNSDSPYADVCLYTAPVVFSREIDFETLIHQLISGLENTVICINSVGFFNGTIFKGSSFGFSKGRIFYRDKGFTETQTLIELGYTHKAPLYDKESQAENVYKAITMAISDFVSSAGFSGVNLGMSGGIDSAVVGALAVKALGPERVRCFIMPSRYSGSDTMSDAEKICKRLAVKYDIIDIDPVYRAFASSLEGALGEVKGLTEENLQARIRGILNMTLSNDRQTATLVTGNKSECSVGYCTLYGDTAGSLAPIADLYKHEVYELADYLNSLESEDVIPQSIIRRAPSAELSPGQKDSDSLPEYDVLDKLLYMLIEENATVKEAAKEAGADIATARRVYTLLCRAEFKRKQYPMGVIVSKSSFAFDAYWDYPIMNKFRP